MTSRIKSGRTVWRTWRRTRKRKVAIQVPLVKLIEDDGTDILQKRVSQELAGEDTFGEEAQPCVSGEASFEPDLEADFFSQGPAAFLGDSGGACSRGDAPWLEDDHRLILGRKQTGFEDRRRHSGCFSGARRSDEHERSPGESLDDFRKSRVNRELVHRKLVRSWSSIIPASIRCLACVRCQIAVGSTLVCAGCIGPPGLTASAAALAAAFALCLPSVFRTIALVWPNFSSPAGMGMRRP